MLTIIALIVFVAALYFVRKWLMSESKSLEADFEADIQVAEQAAQKVEAEVKAKL